MLWVNERQIPDELLALLDDPTTPKKLWELIAKARDEVEKYGAVTYSLTSNLSLMPDYTFDKLKAQLIAKNSGVKMSI